MNFRRRLNVSECGSTGESSANASESVRGLVLFLTCSLAGAALVEFGVAKLLHGFAQNSVAVYVEASVGLTLIILGVAVVSVGVFSVVSKLRSDRSRARTCLRRFCRVPSCFSRLAGCIVGRGTLLRI